MSAHNKLRKQLYSSVGPVLLVAMSLATTDSSLAACMGPGAPTTTQTKCVTGVLIPGNPLRSFDISWVNPDRAEYYLADRANAGITIVDTRTLKWKRTIGGFVGIIPTNPMLPVNNNLSGPDGVTTHGRWLYAGDGNSTLKVIDLDNSVKPIQQTIPTGGTTRLDEMALTTDGKLLLAANNAEDPPFGTLFKANGDAATSNVFKITKITVDATIIVPGFGQSIEQPAWDPKTQRFYTSIPWIANNPPGCNANSNIGAVTCDGGLLVTDPFHPPASPQGLFDQATGTGVIPLHACGPNGATVGVHDNLMLGCNPGNNGSNVTTLVINAKTHNYANIGLITGADEVWFNSGDRRYYLGASKNCKDFTKGPCPTAAQQSAVLGVIDKTSVLIETIPQSSNSHSVAADSKRNLIFVPQVATGVVGGDTNTTPGTGNPTVGQLICGTTAGCIAVYKHDVDDDDHEGDDDHKDDRRSER
jgi:hypothetical protein